MSKQVTANGAGAEVLVSFGVEQAARLIAEVTEAHAGASVAATAGLGGFLAAERAIAAAAKVEQWVEGAKRARFHLLLALEAIEAEAGGPCVNILDCKSAIALLGRAIEAGQRQPA